MLKRELINLRSLVVKYFRERPYCISDIFDKFLISYLCKIDVNKIDYFVFQNGQLIVFTNRRVYKIQLVGNSLCKDIHNRKEVFRNSYLTHKVKILCKDPLIISSTLLKKTEINTVDIFNLLLELSKQGEINKEKGNKFTISILYALDAFDYYKINKSLKEKMVSLLQEICKKEIRMGVVHGDFHSGNVLYGKNQKCFLIDFDCSRKYDIQAYDAFYYIFEEERKKVNKEWLLVWPILWKKKEEIINRYGIFFDKLIDMGYEEIMIIFFVERLGQEFNNNNIRDRKKIIRIIHIIVSYFENKDVFFHENAKYI